MALAAAGVVQEAVCALRAQLAELDVLEEDEDTAALRQELVAAIRDAEHEDIAASVPHSAAFGNEGIHPRNRCALLTAVAKLTNFPGAQIRPRGA
jgi:hypothetical protein